MINEIIHGITLKLCQAFGDGVRVYSESSGQELKKPYLLVTALNPSRVNMIGRRSLRRHPFEILYYPAVQGSNNELQSMATNLYDALESIIIEGGDLIYGTKMNHTTIEGILHFYVNFDVFVKKVVTSEAQMEVMNLEADVKEG